MLSIIHTQEYCFSNLRIADGKKQDLFVFFFLSLSHFIYFSLLSAEGQILELDLDNISSG